MFVFDPLPLASVVGLAPAAAVLDKFLPPTGPYSPAMWRMVGKLVRNENPPGLKPRPVTTTDAGDLRDWLAGVGAHEQHAAVGAAWELWQDRHEQVVAAVTAATQQREWGARRRVADSPEARRQLRHWSGQAADQVPAAVAVADRVAAAVNAAAASTTTNINSNRKVVPSWR